MTKVFKGPDPKPVKKEKPIKGFRKPTKEGKK